MRPSRLAALLTPLILIATFTNCSSTGSNTGENSAASNASTEANSVPHDNTEELAMLVKLPFEPEEVAWKENPENKQLVAVLRFSPENAGKFSAEIEKMGQPVVEDLPVETWYPPVLVAQGELTGESAVRGTSYPAEPLLNPPYTKGKITRVENTDYFILQMSS